MYLLSRYLVILHWMTNLFSVSQMRHYHINLTLFGIGFGIVGSFHYLCTIITVLVYEYKH